MKTPEGRARIEDARGSFDRAAWHMGVGAVSQGEERELDAEPLVVPGTVDADVPVSLLLLPGDNLDTPVVDPNSRFCKFS